MDKIEKAVNDQIKEITVTSKSYDDWSPDIMLVAAKLVVYLKEVKDKLQGVGEMSK